jgi:hypothetical protein
MRQAKRAQERLPRGGGEEERCAGAVGGDADGNTQGGGYFYARSATARPVSGQRTTSCGSSEVRAPRPRASAIDGSLAAATLLQAAVVGFRRLRRATRTQRRPPLMLLVRHPGHDDPLRSPAEAAASGSLQDPAAAAKPGRPAGNQ